MPHENLTTIAAPSLQTECSVPLESELHKRIAHASLRFGMRAFVIVFCRGRVVWAQDRDGLMPGWGVEHTALVRIATEEDQLWIIPDVEHCRDAHRAHLLGTDPPIRFVAGCPAWGTDGSRSAALCVYDTAPRQFDSVDLAILQELTNDIAHQVNAWARTALDARTGIAQPAGFMPLVNAMLAGTTARGLNASLIRITASSGSPRQELSDTDISHFADVLCTSFRGTDYLSRLGECEFAVLMIGSNYAEAVKAVARFQAALQAQNLARPKAERPGCTYTVVQYDGQRHRGIVDLLQDATG